MWDEDIYGDGDNEDRWDGDPEVYEEETEDQEYDTVS
jgi:hypothetical protein